MRAILNSIGQKSREIGEKINAFFREGHTKQVAYRFVLIVVSFFTIWGGWEVARIAAGKIPGVTPSFLPATLPLLLSGTLYIDRFAAVFCVMLAAVLLLTFSGGTKGALKRGLVTGLSVLGVLTAATPLTLVAWLVLVALGEERDAPQKTRLRFLLSIGALALSVLVFSGGAFLADMTVVATVAAQLPPGFVFFALVLLFGGALGTMRDLKGAYLLVPAYVVLRFCLFFLGSASAGLLTVTALVAALAALFVAKTSASHAFARSSFYLLLACVPLTMISVQMQVITAVQCFLFGGLAVAASGLLADVRVVWAKEWERAGVMLTRFFSSVLPGTLMGSGALLVCAGLWAMGEGTSGMFERIYLLVLAALFLKTLLLLARLAVRKTVEVGEGMQFSGPAQVVLLLGAGAGFAHMLALLGTTIGGEIPDWIVEFPFATTTRSFIPLACLIAGAVVVALLYLLKIKKSEVWVKISTPVLRAYAWGDARNEIPHVWERSVAWGAQRYNQGKTWLEKIDARMAHAPLKETVLVLLACFVVTLIVLF